MDNFETKAIRLCRCFNATVLILISLLVFLIPGFTVVHDLADSNIRSAQIPKSAWRLHRGLSPRYARWAKERLQSTQATKLSTADISGTEWPLFGSVFYLWATESLQDAWDKNSHLAPVAPKIYAKEAIEAAVQLVIDPKQANWVKIHWGDKYLTNQNVFYRMLVISALTSHARLTGDREYLPMLKDQVEGLSGELDASEHGILDDYPGQCYPGDVLTAIAMIHRADQVLGTDHSAFVNRAIRGFQGEALDRGLVPYSANAGNGKPIEPSRGCGDSYVSLFSPEIWPEQARKWYDLYSKNYWQETWTCAGFREFPKDLPGNEWYVDVDSGPVLKGFGCSACAFGVGAARANGHFEHAYPLTAELLVTSCPLVNGTLLIPRLLSNAADAPLLGEAAVLFNLTRLPAAGTATVTGGSIPGFVIIVLTLQLGIGVILFAGPILSLHRWRKDAAKRTIPWPGAQFGIWAGLLVAVIVLVFCGKYAVALAALLSMQLFPRWRKLKEPEPAESKAA